MSILVVGFATSGLLAQSTPSAQPSSPVEQLSAAATSLPFTEIPYYADWASSPHADHGAMAFNHWNSEGAIPTDCARCHSTPGFLDYLGADGTAPRVVDHPAPIGTVITCIACHNAKTLTLTSVVFPSGLEVDNLGPDARCMTCHQGTESTKSVNAAVAGMDDDTVNSKLTFINVHYRAAAATLMGNLAQVAYQYPDKQYAGRLQHQDPDHPFAQPYNHCTACHDLHTVAVKVADCSACHKEVTDADQASLQLIRVSTASYDGTGDAHEGVAQEIGNLHKQLLSAIQLYAKQIAKMPIAYNGDSYPYFFVDTNGNGQVDSDEAKVPNQYKSWTPRLLKAAYNYQFVEKDPGAFAHNPIYTVEILHDLLADLAQKVSVDVKNEVRP